MHSYIAGIEYHLPKAVLSTETLSTMFPAWSVEALDDKLGVRERHIASDQECASDLAVAAASKLFQSGICSAADINYILLCTQSPDYVLPTTACSLQDRLGISRNTGAIDFNLGCSGFVYGLGLSEGLISSRQANTVLLITAETYSKYISPTDRNSRTIFGDGAAATLIRARRGNCPAIGPFVYGTDGAGSDHLIVRNSGARKCSLDPLIESASGSKVLTMKGPEVFQFAMDTVPNAVRALLGQAELTLDRIDMFVFHQANAYLLEQLRQTLNIPKERFLISIRDSANTVSSTIPIALRNAMSEGRVHDGDNVMVVGFGVGYSWAATIVRWLQS